MRCSILFLIIFLLASFPTFANETRADIFTKAQKGDASSQYEVGLWYLNGRGGVKADCYKAEDWLAKSANQNEVAAMLHLYYLYDSSSCIHNPDKANFWLIKAAKIGNDNAQWLLGDEMYKAGNFDGAIDWLEKSSMQGNEHAQFSLAKMYEKGGQLVSDYNIKAYAWCSVSASMGNAGAIQHLSILEKILEPASLNKAKKLAEQYHQKYTRRSK